MGRRFGAGGVGGWGVSCRDFGVTVVPRGLMHSAIFLQTETSREQVRAVF